MHVSPTSEDWKLAGEVRARFAERSGANHIATTLALAHLPALLRTHEPSSVIEFGAGIGTMTYLLLTYPPGREVVSMESNPFCCEQIRQNIPLEVQSRMTLITNGEIPDGSFDLAVIDGRIPRDATYSFLKPGLVCFVEGARKKVRKELQTRAHQAGLNFHFDNYARGVAFRLRWIPTRFGIPRPRPRIGWHTGCVVGEVQR